MSNWSKTGARLPCSQSCWGSQYQPQQSPPIPPPAPPKQPVARSLRASFAKRGSRRRSLDARVTDLVFVLFKNRFLTEPSLPTPGEYGKWQQEAGVESENKRMTDYNLQCKLAAEGRKGKRRRSGPAGKETALQLSTLHRVAGASQVPPRTGPPAPAAASRPTGPSQDALPPEPDPRPGLPAGEGGSVQSASRQR